MTIFIVQFDVDRNKSWSRLLDVFVESILLNMPDVMIVEKRIKAPDKINSRPKNVVYNTRKLEIWNEYMSTATDNTIFADCDMLAMGSAYYAFNQEFDIAFTFHEQKMIPPMNGGIVFARPTQAAREYMQHWFDINCEMYKDPVFHHKWRSKYLGMNQAAFGYIYEKEPEYKIKKMPTRIWNAVNQDWKDIDDETVFLHIKSELRRSVLSGVEPYGSLAKAMKAWYKVDGSLDTGPIPGQVRIKSTMNPHGGGVCKKKVKKRGRRR